MNRLYFVLLLIVFSAFSCRNNEKTESVVSDNSKDKLDLTKQSEGYTLLKNNCYACHSIITKSHDDIIAPPLVAIKRRYKAYYENKESFVDGIANWVSDPKEENALMRGAVSQFKVMPKLFYKTYDIKKIASFIYENELEKPAWFETHFNNEHTNGMKSGIGRGKRKGRGMNRNNF